MADKNMVLWILEKLQGEFKRAFPPEGIKMVKKQLLAAPEVALEKAFDYWVLNGRFPSPEQFRDRVEFETKEIRKAEAVKRELEWGKVKGGNTREELNRAGSIFTHEQQGQMAKDSVGTILELLTGRLTREQYLEAHDRLAQKYPSCDFAYTEPERNHLLRAREHCRPISEGSPQFRLRMGYRETEEGT